MRVECRATPANNVSSNWKPPMSSVWKLNSDAAQWGGNGAALGFSVRNLLRDIVQMGYKRYVGWGGAEVEEVKALLFGLKMAWDCRYRKVIAESDSLSIIEKIKRRVVPSSSVGLMVCSFRILCIINELLALSFALLCALEGRVKLAHECHDIAKADFGDVDEYV